MEKLCAEESARALGHGTEVMGFMGCLLQLGTQKAFTTNPFFYDGNYFCAGIKIWLVVDLDLLRFFVLELM
jgi:hypothetical protein